VRDGRRRAGQNAASQMRGMPKGAGKRAGGRLCAFPSRNESKWTI
jgi:hypothetical protein